MLPYFQMATLCLEDLLPVDWKEELLKLPRVANQLKMLNEVLTKEYATGTVYPEKENIFKALHLCPVRNVKVVILAQDPYINDKEAQGLAFSVPENIGKVPPSLVNIKTEIKNETGQMCGNDLTYLASQGILLLNSTLTVRAHQSNSHATLGWDVVTDAIIAIASQVNSNVVFMLWGKSAQDKEVCIKNVRNHCILKTSHPSPLSVRRGFFGCNHFLECNKYLITNKKSCIQWGK